MAQLSGPASRPDALLLIGTYRPADVVASSHPLHGVVQELQAKGQCHHLALAPLSESAINAYLTNHFTQTELPTEVSHAIQRRTEGNPLFLVNIVAYLSDQGLLRPEAGPEELAAQSSGH